MGFDFRGVVDALPGLIWTTQADGRNDFVNRSWRDFTGLGPEQSRDHGWQAAIHPDDRSTLLETWEEIRRTGVAKEIYIRLRRSDGEYRWFTLSPSLEPQGAGPAERWCWLGMDADEGPVTDGRLRRLFDMLPLQAAFLNRAGTSEFSNRQTLEDYGMTLEQLAAWQTSGAIHEDDHPIVHEQLERLMTTGKMFDATLRMRYKDGSYRWMRSRCVPCRDANGNIARYVTVQSDVHDLKLAEDLLAAEVKLLEMVARGEPVGWVLSALRQEIEELCGNCSCTVLRVAPDRTRFHAEASASMQKAYGTLLETMAIDGRKCPWSLAVAQRAPVIASGLTSDPRWAGTPWLAVMNSLGVGACWSIPILSGAEQAVGVLAVHLREPVQPTIHQREIIDRFAKIAGIAIARAVADAALNKTRSELAHVARVATLNAMTASIAHEVSQPLAGILTNANTCVRMLAADPPNLTGAADTARRTIRDADRASDVVNRLRAMFSNKTPAPERIDLNDVTQEVITLSASELQRSRVLLQSAFAKGLPLVSADRVELQQVILNLLLNAAEAMSDIEDRPRTILVQTGVDDNGGVRLEVQDSGSGVDPNSVEKLFDAFYTTKSQGMGVGLSISRSIIEKYDGRLWAANNEGPGATFGFFLPRATNPGPGV